ncbi:MAG TPA: tetratricopeptide repeat protein [Anaeromyxobacteraceae bacterium]|nr:tetratricopeptide repeat protein [Anaeromyxobacteraceae bacterium]
MRRRLARAALAALALALACSAASRRLDDANAARHAGRPKEALAGYQEVLAELGDGRLGERDAALRLKALRYAADVSYLELGDYQGALSYYRRIVALHPGTEAAWKARAAAGDIFKDRFGDRVAAITQWADVAAGESAEAPAFQLRVAREYLDLGDYSQARTEARILRERWPTSELSDEAQLLTAQAWALEKRPDEASRAFQALLERRPRPDVAARALEGQAHLAAQDGKLDRALDLYGRALHGHPSPDTIRRAIDSVEKRREAARTVHPGDRAAALDHHVKQRMQEDP